MTGTHDDEDDPHAGRWQAEIDATAASLAAHLGQPVTVVRRTEIEDGFFCAIRGPEPSGATLQLAWEGVLGMQRDDGGPSVSASLFLFSRGRRLRLDDQPGSYLELTYDGDLDGGGTWRDHGWLSDDLDEFGGRDSYGG